MVDRRLRAGDVLDSDDVAVLGEAGGDDEGAVDVVAAGRDLEGLGHLDDEVGLAELPAVVVLLGGRCVGGVALGGAGGDPGPDAVELRRRSVGSRRGSGRIRDPASTAASGGGW